MLNVFTLAFVSFHVSFSLYDIQVTFLSVIELKTTVEDWVLSEFEIKIDFDVEDALSDLSELGILK